MKNKTDSRGMIFGASPTIFERARELRADTTNAENALWAVIRKNQLGVKFRRQHPIAQYIVDFYCHQHKLVIELDGGYHFEADQKQRIRKDKNT